MELPPDLLELWRSYVATERAGIRSEMLSALRAFTAGLSGAEPSIRSRWVDDFLRWKLDDGADLPLRGPLFEQIVFPVLAEQHRSGGPLAALRLGQLAQELYQHRRCWEALGYPSEMDLFREAHRRDPSSEQVRHHLVHAMARFMNHTLHEVPGGVLYGMNAATIRQCDELLKILGEFRDLLRGGERETFRELLAEASFHYRRYREYLATTKACGYAEFLCSTEAGSCPSGG